MHTMRLLLLGGLIVALGGCGQASDTTLEARTPSYVVQLTVDVSARDTERAVIEVRDQAGQPVVADAVTVVPVMSAMGHSQPPTTVADATELGHYRLEGDVFTMAGAWEIDVVIEVGTRIELARFSLDVQE